MTTKKSSFFANGDKPARTVAGWNVYQDDRGQNILYVKSTQTGYIIQKKDESSFTLYHNRAALSIAVFMLLASLTGGWRMPLVVGVVLFALLEFRYRRSWLPSLARVEKFKPAKKRTMVDALVDLNNKPRTLLLAILYAAFGILFIIYIIQQYTQLLLIIGAAAVLIGCLYMSFNYFKALSKMK